ncbi:MAG: glutamate--cysteine ligase [Bdellovibrionaceae bacterium]|nr:glutamate--cysteine ligase [Pseudobdellovibrionaceae bacterium]
MNNALLHDKILKNMPVLCDWYNSQKKSLYLPFYSSYDIRDACFKVTNVDANIFPAGFNNICQTDKESAPELVKTYLQKHYPGAQKILLITEDHFKNLYYWENVAAIRKLILCAGYTVTVGMPGLDVTTAAREMESYLGTKVPVEPIVNKEGQLQTPNGFIPDVVISNNDFSKLYEHWTDISRVALTPSMDLGWYKRKKSIYFKHYNDVASEFAHILELDPWLFTVKTEVFEHFDVGSDERRQALADNVETFLGALREEYKKRGIQEEPYVFVKNNAGTYGLGVTRVNSSQDVLNWTYDARKKMKAQKGGGKFSEVIIQEGVPTIVKSDAATAEPTIYMIGEQLAGGFLRAHDKKDERESLNSPGAVYKRLCLSDLRIQAQGCPLENVYGWIAKIGLLAIGRETSSYQIKYHGYTL